MNGVSRMERSEWRGKRVGVLEQPGLKLSDGWLHRTLIGVSSPW